MKKKAPKVLNWQKVTTPPAGLIREGHKPKPEWWAVYMRFPPAAPPTKQQWPAQLKYPEDELREEFFRRYPEARHAPVNARTMSAFKRHISDKFVFNQMRLIRRGRSELDAFNEVSDRMSAEIQAYISSSGDLFAKLSDPRLRNYYSRVFVASWTDSMRDRFLFEQSGSRVARGTHITLDDVVSPSFDDDGGGGNGDGDDATGAAAASPPQEADPTSELQPGAGGDASQSPS